MNLYFEVIKRLGFVVRMFFEDLVPLLLPVQTLRQPAEIIPYLIFLGLSSAFCVV